VGLKDDSVVLYLGASTGTTVSHVSDIAANGMIFAVESAPRVMRELIFLAEQRSNIAPIFVDANQPQLFAKRCAKASWLYQDISQKQQAEIFLKNVAAFLSKGSYAFLAVKARSIDVRRKPDEIFAEVRAQLSAKLKIIQEIKLEPYQKDHCMFVCRN
jgi:fibrillarin-like pre-rRNA processing protein